MLGVVLAAQPSPWRVMRTRSFNPAAACGSPYVAGGAEQGELTAADALACHWISLPGADGVVASNKFHCVSL